MNAAEESEKTAPARGLVEQAYREIRRRILDNVYPPGYRGLEQEFADELEISRTPVREALQRLQAEGLVEVIPRHGARILPVSPDDMREIYQLLIALEPMAAEIVARKALSREALQPLIDASKDMTVALKDNNLDAWALADDRFHRYLIECTGNKLMLDTIQRFWDRAHRARMVTMRLRPKPVNSTREHIAIVDAIRAGDAELSAKLFRAHRERGSAELIAILEKAKINFL
jgi:DNA-binding GntR family transcriptional regulator